MKARKNPAPDAALAPLRQGRPKGLIARRVLAAVVDLILVALICQILFTLFGRPDWGGYFQMQEAVRGLPATDPLVVERMARYQACLLLTLAVGAAYETLGLVLLGGSAGKLIFGLRVADAREGRPVYLSKLMLAARAVLKAFSLYLLSALPFLILCLTSLSNADGRSGFDLFAGTKVISVRSDTQ